MSYTNSTDKEYNVARKMLEGDIELLQALYAAVPWGSIWQLIQMAGNPNDSHWGWGYMTFRAHPEGGYIRTCGYGSRFERTNDTIVIVSCSKHRVVLDLDDAGRIIKINSGLEESTSSFGHNYDPGSRARIIAERLLRTGIIKVAPGATAEVEAKWSQLHEVKKFLTKNGPERPGTKVRKALARWPRWSVLEMAGRLWPVSYKAA